MQIKKTLPAILLVSAFVSLMHLRCGSPSAALMSTMGGNPQLTGISSMLKGAGGLAKLVPKGPFTFLAPTNNAISAMGAGVLENLLKPENKDSLAGILRKHILPGKFTPQQVKAGGLKDAAGNMLNLGGAGITEIIPTKGGQILVIDRVLN